MSKGESPLVHRIKVRDKDGRVIGEKEVVSYRGLLDMVHRERLAVIETTLVQAPTKENGDTAIVHARVKTSRGSFTGIGDANPKNVNAKIAPHIIRMAETRAEARAMRKAVNIGVVAIEELGDDLDDSLTYEGVTQSASNGAGGHGQSQGNGPGTGPARPAGTGPSRSAAARASENQRRYVYRLLAERGIEGDAASVFVKKELGVASLTEASQAAVSALIDKLKANGSGANGHSASGAA